VQSADLPLGSPITPNLDQFQALAAAPDVLHRYVGV